MKQLMLQVKASGKIAVYPGISVFCISDQGMSHAGQVCPYLMGTSGNQMNLQMCIGLSLKEKNLYGHV